MTDTTMNPIQKRLLSGEPVIFSRDDSPDNRKILADWLEAAFRKGVSTKLENAIVDGQVSLRNLKLEPSITLTSTTFVGPVDFSFTTFERFLDLRGCVFQSEVNFDGADLRFGINLVGAKFLAFSKFEGINVNGNFSADDAVFTVALFNRSKIAGLFSVAKATFKLLVAFDGATIEDTSFGETRFEGDVRFVGTHIKGDLNVRKAVFIKMAAFDGATIDGSFFLEEALFEDESRYVGMSVRSTLSAQRTRFKGAVNFDNAKIAGSVYMNPTTFEDVVKFGGSTIGWQLSIEGSTFKKKLSLEGIQADTIFLRQAIFEAEMRLIASRITRDLYAEAVNFKGPVELHQTKVDGNAFFDASTFNSKAEFTGARFESACHLKAVSFLDNVSFRDANLGDLYFQPPPLFRASVELAGAAIRRFHADEAIRRSFVDSLHTILSPFNHYPYVQLEKTFRDSGDDELADYTYYVRRLQQGNRIRPHYNPLKFIRDRIYRWTLGYGVKPFRPLVFFIIGVITILVGAWVFLGPDAMQVKNSGQTATDLSLSLVDAFLVSLKFFLPGIGIIGTDAWEPTRNKIVLPLLGCQLPLTYVGFANIERLIGFVTIPITFVAITGLFSPRK